MESVLDSTNIRGVLEDKRGKFIVFDHSHRVHNHAYLAPSHIRPSKARQYTRVVLGVCLVINFASLSPLQYCAFRAFMVLGVVQTQH
jgi:hypothetical protein